MKKDADVIADTERVSDAFLCIDDA